MFNFLAQTSNDLSCTINGREGTPEECEQLVATFGIVALLFIGFFAIIGIVSFVFWIINFIHVIQHDDVPNRTLWIVLLLLVGGSWIIYYFVVKRPYDKEKKQMQNQTGAAGAPPQIPAQPPADQNQQPPQA